MTLSAQAVDFGLSTSSVRYGSKYLEKEPGKTAFIFKTTFLLKLLLGLPVLVLLMLAAPRIATGVFGKVELALPLLVAFCGSFCILLANFPLGVLQTYQSFRRYVLVAVTQGAVQVILVALLVFLGRMEPDSVIIAFAAAPFIAFLLGMTLIPRTFMGARGDTTAVIKEIMGFGKWVMVSTFATMFIIRLDVLMLTAMAGSGEVGRYSSASQLAYLFPLVTGALTTALLPKATGLTGRHELRRYVVDTLRFTPLSILVAVPLLLFARPVVGTLFGARFIDAVPIFRVLLLCFLVSVICNPASLALYSLDRVELLAYLNLAQLGINFAGNLVLIPLYGGLGAAFSSLAVRVFGGVYIVYFLRKFLFTEAEPDR